VQITGQNAEGGCCEDLKAAFAHFDTFYLRQYFTLPVKGKAREGRNETEMK